MEFIKNKLIVLIHYSKKKNSYKSIQFLAQKNNLENPNLAIFVTSAFLLLKKIKKWKFPLNLVTFMQSHPNFVHQKLIPYNRNHANIHSTLHSSLLFINVARKFSGFRPLWQGKPQFHTWAYRLDRKKNTTNHTTYTYILKQ